ncbi:MAG: hypothetical protein Q7R40_06460 [Phaeospirillum sp.]|nr:hypothetical protein [Phaeospirillum sp.]
MVIWYDDRGVGVLGGEPYTDVDGTYFGADYPKAEIAALRVGVAAPRPDESPAGYTVDGQPRGGVSVDPGAPWSVVDGVQVWHAIPRPDFTPAERAAADAQRDAGVASAALLQSGITLERVTEAVAQGKTTWAAADVQAWFPYRQTLRDIISGRVAGPAPARPAYPAGT